MPRPSDLFTPRPDNKQSVDSGTNINVGNVRLRSELNNDESRHTFAIVHDSDAPSSNFPYVQGPLQEGTTASALYLEGYLDDIQSGVAPATALANNQGSWQPPAKLNLITTLTAVSYTGPVKIKPYVDGNLQSSVYDQGRGWQFAQIAELSEFEEFVNLLGGTLDGSHTLRWDIENKGPDPVEGSLIIRLLGKEVSQ